MKNCCLPDAFAGAGIEMIKKLRLRCKTISANLTKMISFSADLILQINFFDLRLVQRVGFENHWAHVIRVM